MRAKVYLGFTSASLLALSSPVWANAAQAAQPSDATPDTAVDASTIVVTGTRISTAGFQAPTPVTVVQTDQLIQRAPGTIADALNQLPVFQNSINQNQSQNVQGTRQRTGNYLNLRALGTQRVLVLQDGQRLPQSGNNGGVDTNLIPQLLTERVDIVTGGASATYGSDAVSGVVNFVLAKRFRGIKAQAQAGIATGGYGASYRIGFVAGTALADDRLHLVASAERYHIDAIAKTEMPEIAEGWLAVGSGTAADPFRYVNNVRTIGAYGGYPTSGPVGFVGRQFAPNGDLVAFDPGIPAGRAGFQIGGDGAISNQGCCTITPSATTNQLFARAEYEFSPKLSLFASVGYNFGFNFDIGSPANRGPITIFRDNAYLTPSTLAALGNTASFTTSRQFLEFAGNDVTQRSRSLVIATGLNGMFGEFKWALGYTHAKTWFSSRMRDSLNQNFYASLDAVKDPATGNIVCRVSLTNPGLYPGCIPTSILGVGSVNPQAYEYFNGYSEYAIENNLDSVQANISGKLFENWAGPVLLAVGAEYRKQSLLQTSNADPTIPTSFTGLRGVASTAMLRFFITNVGVAQGDYSVKEAFAELNLPLAKDTSFGSLSVNAAARLTDYSTSGTVVTWKAGAIYDMVDGIRFRVTRSRDIRAPTLFELFAGQTVSQSAVPDKLTNSIANAQAISGGNPDLKPEVANTLTAGVVLKPSFLPGLTFSADYFNITISNAIGIPFSAAQVVDICNNSNQTSLVCGQIVRDPGNGNAVSKVFVNNQNLSIYRTSGIDFELRDQFRMAGGNLTLQALATVLLTAQQVNAPGEAIRDFLSNADLLDNTQPVAQPKWRSTISVSYEKGPLTLSVQERIIGALNRSKLFVYQQNDIPAVAYTDLSLVYKMPTKFGNFEVFGTANNLFDKDAPLIPNTTTPGITVPTIRSAYDIIGRYVTFGVRVKY